MITRNKTQLAWRYGFAVVLIVAGLLALHYNVGNEFLGFSSVGTWIIYVGFVMLAIITLQLISNKKRLVNERMQWIAMKSARVTFVAIILVAFFIMSFDGIEPITIPYSYFMSYFVCGILLVYFISYKIFLKYN